MSLYEKERCYRCRHARWEHRRDTSPGKCRCPTTVGTICACDAFVERPVYLGFSTELQTVHMTVESHHGVLIDVDADGRLVGVEIIDPPGTPRLEDPPYIHRHGDMDKKPSADA